MQHSVYHSVLRIASLTLAFVLVFESGLLSEATKEISLDTREYLASAIGINASVIPTELNQITADLTARENDLAKRETELAEREISVGLNQRSDTSSGMSTFLLSSMLFILLVLILLNYLLDYIRRPFINRQHQHEGG